ILPILTYPNPLLKQISNPVDLPDPSLAKALADLTETLYDAPGCTGIAAPQVGILKRIVLIDASRNAKCQNHHGKHILINPVIQWQQGEVIGREGCLSIPDLTANVKRAQHIRVFALNPAGEEITIETSDFEARLILHEVDHLDGLLFLDRVASLKTDVFR